MDTRSMILLNKGKIKIKPWTPPKEIHEKLMKIYEEERKKGPNTEVDVAQVMIRCWTLAKIYIPLEHYLRKKGLNEIQIEEVSGWLDQKAREKGYQDKWYNQEKNKIFWNVVRKLLPKLIEEELGSFSSVKVRSALMQYLKDLKSGKQKI
jgi:hypothetical protein